MVPVGTLEQSGLTGRPKAADPDWTCRALPFFVEPAVEIAAVAPQATRAVFSLFGRC